MRRFLLIDPDARRAMTLVGAFEASGVETEHIPEAVSALERVRECRPDAIVYAADQVGLTPGELVEALDLENLLGEIALLIFGRETAIQAGPLDATCFVQEDESRILTANRILAALDPEKSEAKSRRSDKCSPAAEASRISLEGSLEGVGLPELILFFGRTVSTGRLSLQFGDATASLYYRRGFLLHAEADSVTGLEAVTELLARRPAPGGIPFAFTSTSEESMVGVPQTLEIHGMELLLEAGMRLDHASREEAGP